MQGDITHAKRNKNQPLADMLVFVSGYADKDKRQRILELAIDILHVKTFDIEHPFEDYEFLPLGINGYNVENTKLLKSNYDVFVVSPFLSDDVINEITKCPSNKILVTRKVSVTPSVINSFNSVYITKDILNDNEFGVKQDIHAKLYFTVTNEGNYLYIGSANASHNAFYKNVEFLLKLKYKPNCVGFKTFYNDFIPEENCPYEVIKSAPEKEALNELQDATEKAFKEAIYSIKGAIVVTNGDYYDVKVESKAIKTKEIIKIAPMQRQDLLTQLQTQTDFQGMILKDLSEFYILSVLGQKIIVKIQTIGIPTDRNDAIYKSIIDSKTKFLSYVSFMLSEEYTAAALEEAEFLRMMNGNETDADNVPVSAAIYEKMLKAVHQNPAKLKEIADVIRRLDKDIIGSDFLEMYKQFELAARRLIR